MFFAALWSRSCRVPQDGHCHVRVFKLKLARRYPHAESEIALASLRLRTMFFTARSSRTITLWSRTRLVEVRWRKSARTFRWARAALALALARLADPGWQRARRRW